MARHVRDSERDPRYQESVGHAEILLTSYYELRRNKKKFRMSPDLV